MAQEEKVLRIRLLGPPEASLEERPPLQLSEKKMLALLCYLAAKVGRRSRRELAELLWPESEARRARTDLRAILYRLRKALGEDTAPGGKGARFFVIESDRLGLVCGAK